MIGSHFTPPNTSAAFFKRHFRNGIGEKVSDKYVRDTTREQTSMHDAIASLAAREIKKYFSPTHRLTGLGEARAVWCACLGSWARFADPESEGQYVVAKPRKRRQVELARRGDLPIGWHRRSRVGHSG